MYRSLLTFGAVMAAAGAARADGPTYAKQVAAILDTHCVSCHRPAEVGPFSLQTYDDARKRAMQIARITASRTMPPWKPDPGHGAFQDARKLTDAQIGTLAAWAAAGAPEGDPATRPKPPAFPDGWHLGPPDLVLKVPAPFAVPAEGDDVYVHFVFPAPFDSTKYLKAAQVRPSNRKVAHHGVQILDGSGTARAMAKKHGGHFYPNFGGPGFLPRGFLPGYAPGMTTRVDAKDNRGMTIDKSFDLVLQMHYHPIGKVEYDQPEIGLYFTDKKPERNVNVLLLGTEDVDIPAGAKSHKRTDSFTVPADFELRDVFAHMHMIGKQVQVWAEVPPTITRGRVTKPAAKVNLLKISDWDFNWQDTYRYAKPVVLPKGTVVRAEFTWDNTAENPRNPNRPPKRVTLGEGSTDEMAGIILGGVAAKPQDEAALWIGVIAHYFEIGRTKKK